MISIIAVGSMSGTSCDGLDLSVCEYYYDNNNWSFKLLATKEILFNSKLREDLINSTQLCGQYLSALDAEYGAFIGQEINAFLLKEKLSAEIIGSHGYTVFHDPKKNYSLQIGNGANITAETGIDTVSNFRSLDVALGGQGAPLAPTGDQLLFNETSTWINLGGIANISFPNGKGEDICPLNLVLNKLCKELNLPFDNEGTIAKTGSIDLQLMKQLEDLDYEGALEAISIHKQFEFLYQSSVNTRNKLATCVEYFAKLIAQKIEKNATVSFTGGGAHNLYLVERINHFQNFQNIAISSEIINFKEAIIFGFLAVLRKMGRNNSFACTTGASRNNCGGAWYKA